MKHSPLSLSVCQGFLCLLVFLSPYSALGECTCNAVGSIHDEYKAADLVITGRVEKVGPSPYKKGFSKVVVKVFRKLKGGEEVQAELVTIYTPESDADCGYGFAPSNDYLIYATGTLAFFKTTKCSRTNYLESSLKEISTLSTFAKSAPK